MPTEKYEEDNMAHVVKPAPMFPSCRVVLALVGFIGTALIYGMRMNMSVAVICMTNHTGVRLMYEAGLNKTGYTPKNVTFLNSSESCIAETFSTRDGEFMWDKETRGHLLGVFFWGYLVTQIPAGFLVQKVGSKIPILIFTICNGLSCLLFPLAARTSLIFASILRVLAGVASGFWFPCFHHLWSHWAPPNERSVLVGLTYAGIHIGNAVTLPLSGYLCQYGFAGGWPSIFYVIGGVCILWCGLWTFTVFDGPTKHPRISETEKNYIRDSLAGQSDDERHTLSFPILSVIKSLPFWATIVVNCCFDWNGYLFLTSIPTYMSDVLKFNISQSSGWSTLPFIGFWVGQVVAAFFSDFLIKRRCLSTTWTRKLVNSIGMFCPAVILLFLSYVTCENKYLAVFLLTLGLTFKSAVFVGCFVNHVDIAPRYAGILFAIGNTIASTTGYFAPKMVGALTKNNSVEEWRVVFFISAAIYVFGGVFFLIFASGELQEWARDDHHGYELAEKGKELAVNGNGASNGHDHHDDAIPLKSDSANA